MASQESIQLANESLTPEERAAYEKYQRTDGRPLSPVLQAQLYELYLNGNEPKDIVAINKNLTLGMVAKCKVEGLWQERRAAHIADLYANVRDRVAQVQMESVLFASDLLAVANKQFGEKLKRYLLTGDERELGDLSIKSLDGYRKAVELLLKLTGQDGKSQVTVKGEMKQTVEVTAGGRALTPQEAAAILAFVEKDEKK